MRGIVVLMTALTLASSVEAAPVRCYQAGDIEADQAIQYQEELMVVSETCRTKDYVTFVVRNQKPIIEYQHMLIDHFKRTGERSGQAALDKYMTRLANEKSLQYTERSSDGICAKAAEFLTAGGKLDGATFRQLVTARAADRRETYQRCK
jgi:hypothetical protein